MIKDHLPVGVTLELVPGLNLALQGGILLGKLLGIVDHPLDVLGAEPVVVVGDGDLLKILSLT